MSIKQWLKIIAVIMSLIQIANEVLSEMEKKQNEAK